MKGQVTANIKFQDFAEQWFEEYAKLNLHNTSYERMKQLTVRVYLAIEHLRLDKTTSRHIQQFINDLALNCKSLSRKTAIHHFSFISDVFSYAVKMEMLTDNLCKRVTVLKREKKEKDLYTLEDVEKLFQLFDTAPLKYRVFFTLAIYSGFRRGEMLGTKWVDYDRLFVKWNGESMNNQPLYGWLKEFCEKNDMPFYGIYSFRSGTTLNVYSNMFQNAQARVAQDMGGAFSFLPQDSTT